MSPSLIILVTISILLNIYFIVYFVMKRRSNNRIVDNPENPLTPEASKNEGNTNPELNVESPTDEDLKSAKDHNVV